MTVNIGVGILMNRHLRRRQTALARQSKPQSKNSRLLAQSTLPSWRMALFSTVAFGAAVTGTALTVDHAQAQAFLSMVVPQLAMTLIQSQVILMV